MRTDPANQNELWEILSLLANVRPANELENAQVVAQCTELSRYLATPNAASLHVPEIVWHFLSDPDIRFKDPRYAEAQLDGLREALSRQNP